MVVPKIFSLNLPQAKSGVISFWVGGWIAVWVGQRKKFGLNLYQVKSGVISFWKFLILRNFFGFKFTSSQIWWSHHVIRNNFKNYLL